MSMKLPQFGERGSTSMSQTFQKAAYQPNTREYVAAQQRFIPKNDPNAYLRLATAQSNQYKAVTDSVFSVANTMYKIYESNDKANMRAAAQYVNNRVAEFSTNAMLNTPREVQDPVTGKITRPWDSMQDALAAEHQAAIKDAREKYNFNLKENVDNFDLMTGEVLSSNKIAVMKKQNEIKVQDTQAKIMETVSTMHTVAEVDDYVDRFVMDNIVSPVWAEQVKQRQGQEFAERDLYRSAEAIGDRTQIAGWADNAKKSEYFRRFLDDASLERHVESLQNEYAEKSIYRDFAEINSVNPYDFGAKMTLLNNIASMTHTKAGYASEADHIASITTMKNRVRNEYNIFTAGMKKDDGYTKALDAVEQHLSSGNMMKFNNEGRGYVGTFLMAAAYNKANHPSTPEAIRNATVEQQMLSVLLEPGGDPRLRSLPAIPQAVYNPMVRGTTSPTGLMSNMSRFLTWNEAMPEAMNNFTNEHLAYYEYATILGMVNQDGTIGSTMDYMSIPEEQKIEAAKMVAAAPLNDQAKLDNKDKWAGMMADDEFSENFVGAVLQGVVGDTELAVEAADNIEFAVEIKHESKKWSQRNPNASYVQNMTARAIRNRFGLVTETGENVMKKNAPEIEFTRGVSMAEDIDFIKQDLNSQRRAYAATFGEEYANAFDDGNITFEFAGPTKSGDKAYFMLLKKERGDSSFYTVVGNPYAGEYKALIFEDPRTRLGSPEVYEATKVNQGRQVSDDVRIFARNNSERGLDLNNYTLYKPGADGNPVSIDFNNTAPSSVAKIRSMNNSEEEKVMRMYSHLLSKVETSADKLGFDDPVKKESYINDMRWKIGRYMQIHHGLTNEIRDKSIERGWSESVGAEYVRKRPPHVPAQYEIDMEANP